MSETASIAFGIAGIVGGLCGLTSAALLYRTYRNDRRVSRGHREGEES